MVKLIIVRHGYSASNKAGRFCGQDDAPLDEIGFQQAKEVSQYIKDNYEVSAIYSSDLSRAYDTLKPLSQTICVPIVKEKGLREIDVGYWRGLTVDEAAEKFPETFKLYKENPWKSHFEGGEGYEDVKKRAMDLLYKIREKHDGKTVAIVTHGGVVRAITAELMQASLSEANKIPHAANASVTVVDWDTEKADFSLMGFCDFLSEKTVNAWTK